MDERPLVQPSDVAVEQRGPLLLGKRQWRDRRLWIALQRGAERGIAQRLPA